MFCTHCGSKNSEHQKFCGFCGRSLRFLYDEQATIEHDCETDYTVQDVGLIRQKELEQIDAVISFFAQQQKNFDEFDYAAKSINELNRVNAKGILVWSIIVQAISLVGAAQGAAGYNYDLTFCLIYLLFGSLISGVLLTLFFSLNHRRKVRLECAIKKYCSCLGYLSNCYYTYKDCPIGIEYVNPSNLNAIREVISSGRAYSIKEALNILVELALQNKRTDFSYMAAKYLVSSHRLNPNAVVCYGATFFNLMY